jgi:5,10-methylenetetrahydromethanopterin reductase
MIELACGLPPGPAFADRVVLAEELGYDRAWIFGSASLWEDPFVHLALAATRTSRIGLATAVLVPPERPPVTMASSIATIARLSDGRFRACFGTGFTSRMSLGQRPMSIDALIDYVAVVRDLLAGSTPVVDGKPARLLQWPGLTADRPVSVPVWLSVFGPRGTARAAEVADGIIGFPHPTLPTATMVSGTVLDHEEDAGAPAVRARIGPWRVADWHTAYATGGATAVDAMPGGAAWRAELERAAPEEERHLLTFAGHVTDLSARDEALLEHIDTRAMVGDAASIGRKVARLAEAGFAEVMYTPTGPDVERELRTFASAAGRTPSVER